MKRILDRGIFIGGVLEFENGQRQTVHKHDDIRTPVVAVFGRWGGGLSPTRWGPTGPRSAVLHHDVGCRPCLAHRCRIGFICLDAVTVDEVVAAAERVMA